MKKFNVKKLVMVGAWWRVEMGANFMINNNSKTLSLLRFGFKVKKLDVLSFLHHIECIGNMIIVEIIDEDVKRPGLWCDPECKYSLIVSQLSSYNIDGGSMG